VTGVQTCALPIFLADSDPHYEESYALLLTAMASGPKVNIWVSGCFETFPKIINLLGARP
jgi:hypothetical protein